MAVDDRHITECYFCKKKFLAPITFMRASEDGDFATYSCEGTCQRCLDSGEHRMRWEITQISDDAVEKDSRND